MELVELVGQAGGFLSTIAVLPQVIKSFKTKRTGDLSLGYLLLLAASMFLWASYGVMISSLPVIIWNTVNEVLVLILVALKLKYG